MPGSFNNTTRLTTLGDARANKTERRVQTTKVGSAKRTYFDNNAVKAVHFVRQAEDPAKMATFRRAPYKIDLNRDASTTPLTCGSSASLCIHRSR